MSELSPAAQVILDASTSVFWRPPIDVPAFQSKSVAAALRAAADQIENLYCDSDVEDSPGIVFALRRLMLIANELETQ
ncbi:hypothetical protein EBT25_07850 [bacterium]|nr:hypothetical protein [bacterium]